MKNVNQISHNSNKIKEIILKNPELPIVVFAGKEASAGSLCDYSAKEWE